MTITKHLNILRPVHTLHSISIIEEDDHFIHLYLGEKRIATFGEGTMLYDIRKEADNIIRIVEAYRNSDSFIAEASDWARNGGWQEPR